MHFGVGYDTTDIGAAAARGIAVSNTPDVLTDCVADTAVGLLIDTLRQFSAADRYVRAGRWQSEGNYPLTRQVSGSRVGIVGLGRIGGAIATRLAAFGCDISYHNRRPVAGSPFAYVASASSSPQRSTCWWSPPPAETAPEHLVDADVIAALGPDGYLVNVARGSVVDEAALVAGAGHRTTGRGRVWTCSSTNRTCPALCSSWTMWCCCRTWPVAPCRPAPRWRR